MPLRSSFTVRNIGPGSATDTMKRTLLVLMLLWSTAVTAQPYRNLVFEGAGMRGLAYVGVLDHFERAGILKEIQRVGGTSAGAITALAVSLGYSAEDLLKLIGNTKFGAFNDGSWSVAGGIHRLQNHYGWYKGVEFEQWLSALIAARTGNGDITFAELHKRGFKDLYITATCLNRQKLVVFSRETYPAMRVRDAVRVSMSIPLYFEAMFVDARGQTFRSNEGRTDLDLMVDGGLLANFPIFIFDKTVRDPSLGNIRVPNPETIGVRMDTDAQIANDSTTRELAPLPITNLKEYLRAFYVITIESLNRSQLNEDDWKRTVSVSSVNIGEKVRDLSQEEKDRLVNSGRAAASRFLSVRRNVGQR